MVNYSNSKIYKIWSHLGDKIYIGSTTKEYLSQRMDTHRSKYKCKTNNTKSIILFDEYGLDNCKIELLEAKECNTKDELLKLEGKYIRELECVNKCISGRTRKEHYQDNKEQILEDKKQYHIENREKRCEKQREYYKNNKEKITEKITCDCGVVFNKYYKNTHQKTKKHLNFIENSN